MPKHHDRIYLSCTHGNQDRPLNSLGTHAKVDAKGICWGPSASEGPQKQDLTAFLEYNV
jgi:hypothetical protein